MRGGGGPGSGLHFQPGLAGLLAGQAGRELAGHEREAASRRGQVGLHGHRQGRQAANLSLTEYEHRARERSGQQRRLGSGLRENQGVGLVYRAAEVAGARVGFGNKIEAGAQCLVVGPQLGLARKGVDGERERLAETRSQGLQAQCPKPLHQVRGGPLLAIIHVAAAVESGARQLGNGLADAGEVLGNSWDSPG